MAEERLWCTACGTVTRDQICDCNRWGGSMARDPHFVNYADEMQKTAHEQAQEIEELRAENAESNRLAASNFRRAKLAEAEVKRLRDAIQSLHRVWFTEPDVNKSAVAAACLSLFVVAAPQIPSAPPPSDRGGPQ